MAKGKVTHTIQIEKLRQLHTWTLRSEPLSDHPNLRRAYERGFHARTQDFNQGTSREVAAMPARVETVGDAWARGYHDALKQG